jgi:hypothetical protein
MMNRNLLSILLTVLATISSSFGADTVQVIASVISSNSEESFVPPKAITASVNDDRFKRSNFPVVVSNNDASTTNDAPVVRLAVTYIFTDIQSNSCTDDISQIIANAVLATTFPTPSLVTVADSTCNTCDAGRRSLVTTECLLGNCDSGDNQGSQGSHAQGSQGSHAQGSQGSQGSHAQGSQGSQGSHAQGSQGSQGSNTGSTGSSNSGSAGSSNSGSAGSSNTGSVGSSEGSSNTGSHGSSSGSEQPVVTFNPTVNPTFNPTPCPSAAPVHTCNHGCGGSVSTASPTMEPVEHPPASNDYTVICYVDYYIIDVTINIVTLIDEASASLVSAVESGQLTDEIQNEAHQTGESACASTEAVTATVDCLTCSTTESAGGILNALTSGQIAGICIGGVVFTSVIFAAVAFYYKRRNTSYAPGNSEGEIANNDVENPAASAV